MGMYILILALYLVFSILATEFLVTLPDAIKVSRYYAYFMVAMGVVVVVAAFLIPVIIPHRLGCSFWEGSVFYMLQLMLQM